MNDGYLLEMKGITKIFPGTLALKDVHLQVRAGEVHSLMGENGAGKSTLMKIALGMLRPDEGEIWLEGKRVEFQNPGEGIEAGIAMIHQELNPILHMTIAENIFLGREPMRKGGVITDKPRQNALTAEILENYGLSVRPTAKMHTLTLAQMQMIEIIKAVTFNAKLIIMDEPTSSLDNDETQNLFRIIDDLKRKNIAVIYISHRLEEVAKLSDTITVLRDGRFIDRRPIAEMDQSTLIRLMVGRELSDIFPKIDCEIRETVLEVKGLTKLGQFQDISFQARAGEILGFSGLIGAGRSEVMKAIFGLQKADSGTVAWKGKVLNIKSTSDAIRNGLAMVTEDRTEYGLVLCRSLVENMSLASLWRHQEGPLISRNKEDILLDPLSKALAIKAPNLKVAANTLSGGNQQKVIIAKWLMVGPMLLIMDEPTRGIDVGSKFEIYKLICQFAAQGMAIILVSSELPEVMGMSDRILVMHEGSITGEYHRKDIVAGSVTQEHLLNSALGV